MSDSSRLLLYDSPLTKERFEVDFPLDEKVDESQVVRHLGLPPWVDLKDPLIRRAAIVLWASDQAEPPLAPKVFGGAGFRLTCPSTNVKGGPFWREMKDLDYVVPQGQGRPFLLLLTSLHRQTGSAHFHFIASDDKRFNGLRGGDRYRLRMATGLQEPATVVVDVFEGKLSFCHDVRVGPVLAENSLTLPLSLLVLMKCQFIARIPQSEFDSRIEHRRLLALKREAIVGMEDKDVLDVVAAFVDHEPGSETFPLEPMLERTSRDWGLAKTVSLNLRNERAVRGIAEARAISSRDVDSAVRRMLDVADQVDDSGPAEPRFSFRRLWWEEVEPD